MLKMKQTLMLAAVIALVLNSIAFCLPGGWTQKQISNSTLVGSDSIDVSGNNYVWVQYVNNKAQIFYSDGNNISQISSGANSCSSPVISGVNIAWAEDISGVSRIMLWNGSSRSQISSSTNSCYHPAISGTNVAWQENGQIMLWNGSSRSQISSGTNSCSNHVISGNRVAWVEYVSGNNQIMLWNGSGRSQISSGTNDCSYPDISGTKVVWQEYISGNSQIMLWNGSGRTQISSGANNCDSANISGTNVIWEAENQIVFWNGGSPLQLTNNSKFKSGLISGNNIVWIEQARGHLENLIAIMYFWDGNVITKIETFSYGLWGDDVKISDDNIAYIGYDENYDIQIFSIKPGLSQPAYQGDINKDSKVNFVDMSLLAHDWLKGT